SASSNVVFITIQIFCKIYIIMNAQDFTKIKHFYFCLLIAILMKQNECYSYGTLHQKKFLMQWLVKAKNKKILRHLKNSGRSR
ncbi:TPA: hypothetical protein ACRRWZ_005116, partial [Klebsiella quasipneumoniae]